MIKDFGFFHDYPYTNFHEMNLDWILGQMLELRSEMKNFVNQNTIKYADPIQWNITTQYEANTIVIDPLTGTAYISSKPVPSGVSLNNGEYWSVVFTLDINTSNKNITSRDDGSNANATFTSEVDDWLLLNGKLYKVIRDIDLGQSYMSGYNISQYTVQNFYDDLITSINNSLEQLKTEIEGITGDLINLTTTDKNNLVAAINELVATSAAIDDKIGDLNDLDTSVKTDIVSAINELVLSIVNTPKTVYNNVAEMKAADVTTGTYCTTLGYYEAGDNGGASYIVGTDTPGLGDVTLNNGLTAKILITGQVYNIRAFGAHGNGVTNDYNVINNVITKAITQSNSTVYIPKGTYVISLYLDSLRVDGGEGTALKDMKHLCIKGEGEESIIYGHNNNRPFDIFQLNEVKNLTIRDLLIYESITASTSPHGANGISITNGGQNIRLENITVSTLPIDVSGGYVDGGKAFTIQCGAAPLNPITDIIINNCKCRNVAIGFETDITGSQNYSENNIMVTNCEFNVNYTGIIISMAAPRSMKPAFIFSNINIRTKQRGLWIARGCNSFFDNINIRQIGSISHLLPDDTRDAAIELFSNSENNALKNIHVYYDNGDYCLLLMADSTGYPTKNVFENISGLGSFAQAMVVVDKYGTGSILVSRYNFFNGIYNVGAPTTWGQWTLDASFHNIIYGYGNFNVYNQSIMTGTGVTHTLGTYSGTAIPIYNTTGSILGYLPLYS